MAGVMHREDVPVPPDLDWDALAGVERFLEDQQPKAHRRTTQLVGPGFSYLEHVDVARALAEIGDRGSDVSTVVLHRSRRGELSVELSVYRRIADNSQLRVEGPNEVAVRGIAQTFRQRFIIETEEGLRWRRESAPAAAEPSPSRWQYISTHPLYSAIIAGLVVVVIAAVWVWLI